MQSRSIYKVPNGKLLKIFLEFNENSNTIENIKITGDFFAYPEESIDTIEKKLKGIPMVRENVLKKIISIIKEKDIQFIGLDAEGLTEGIMLCRA